MAMEDAYVLGELLRSTDTVEQALRDYVTRRKPRAEWVQRESIATGDTLRMSPAIRNRSLRERGGQMMQARFRPLISAL